LAKQSNMCAGCGMRVEAQYTSKMRYCEYLGRYFCTGCHGNQVAIIPGRVITKWDFSRCPVSNFSYRLLDQMQNDALFSLEALNPQLFRKSRQLAKCKLMRMQLVELAGFVSHCRFAEEARERLAKAAGYLTKDLELYSMADLCAIKSGELMTRMQELVALCQQHVTGCTVCLKNCLFCC
jgi:run domain Beclin-1 interacting and cysteine-rich containing protein